MVLNSNSLGMLDCLMTKRECFGVWVLSSELNDVLGLELDELLSKTCKGGGWVQWGLHKGSVAFNRHLAAFLVVMYTQHIAQNHKKPKKPGLTS